MPVAVVAGHICLDVIPSLPQQDGGFRYQPGGLVVVGPVAISTGGAVSNTGVALHRLGVSVRLLGKVGDDPFGRIVQEILQGVDPTLAAGLLVTPGEHTSYSVILDPPRQDRMFLHFPGANDTFDSDAVPDDRFKSAHLFHFGYPPIMRRMYEDGGSDLARLFGRAKAAGLTTSLDMCYPDPDGPGGRADWRHILEVTLPHVDVFLPSLPEMLIMLEPKESRALLRDDPQALDRRPVDHIAALAEELIGMGAGMVGVKAGARGLYLRTASGSRLREVDTAISLDLAAWADRQLWSSAFEAKLVGTTGAGDAAVAGFLLGLLRGLSPEETTTAACAVGAASVEAADAISGVQSWERIRTRMERGWTRRSGSPGGAELEWLQSGHDGLRVGPRDRRSYDRAG